MSDKKHIDRLFQEKFKDFEAQPSAKVWENIQSQLEQPTPKHKKTIPLWGKVASIAAILLLFISIGSIFKDNNSGNDSILPAVVDTNNETGKTNNDTLKEELDNNTSNNSSNTVNSNNINESSEENSLSSSKNNAVVNNSNKAQNNSNSSNNTSVTTQKTNTSNSYNSKKSTLSANEALVNITNNNSSNKTVSNKLNNKNHLNNNSASLKGIANTSNTVENTIKNNHQQTNNNVVYNNHHINSIKKSSQVSNEANQYNSNYNTTNNINATTNATAMTLVNSLNEKEKENIATALDFVKSNAIEEAIAKNQSINEKEKEVDRWTVNANIAPVYYNTLGKGSHIHDQFIDNPKNGELNTSYGIQVGYAFNDRLKLRSGVSKLNLSYDTANVIVYETVTNTPGHSPLRNIDFIPNNQGETLSVLSTDNLGVQQINEFASDKLNAALSQRIDYIEIPLELEYALVNKRFGVNIIGGLSTFILNSNEVVTEVDNRKTLIGTANNINNISFSTNLGIGIDYKFNDAFKFNLEPTFKYQINAYSEVSGDFKPYIIGLYTGFSYRF